MHWRSLSTRQAARRQEANNGSSSHSRSASCSTKGDLLAMTQIWQVLERYKEIPFVAIFVVFVVLALRMLLRHLKEEATARDAGWQTFFQEQNEKWREFFEGERRNGKERMDMGLLQLEHLSSSISGLTDATRETTERVIDSLEHNTEVTQALSELIIRHDQNTMEVLAKKGGTQ